MVHGGFGFVETMSTCNISWASTVVMTLFRASFCRRLALDVSEDESYPATASTQKP